MPGKANPRIQPPRKYNYYVYKFDRKQENNRSNRNNRKYECEEDQGNV